MRRLLFMFLFVIVLSCLGVPRARGYTLVQKNSNTGGTSIAVSFPNATTAGNLIIVSAAWLNGGTASVSDGHNPYVTAAGPPASGMMSQIWYAANIASGATTVTVTFSGSFNNLVNIFEYSGLAATSPLDATSSNTGTSSSLDSGSATTTQANELIFGTGYATCQLSGGANYTLESDTAWQTSEYLGGEDRVGGTAGAYDATFSASACPNGSWVAQIATFKPAAVSGATCGLLDDGSTIYTPQNYTTFVPPAKMVTYADPSFNCTVLRLTDGETDVNAPAGHNYIRSAFNADSSKFLANNMSSGAFYVQDLATGTIIVAENQLEFSGSPADETWDRTNPNIIYYELYNSNVLKKADISACTVSTPCTGSPGAPQVVKTQIAAFSHDVNTPYTILDNNNNKRDISDDGCHLAMGGYYLGSSDNKYHWDAFVYNACMGTQSNVATCIASDQTPNTQTPTQFTAGMTHSNRVWVAWAAFCSDTNRTGTQLYDSNMTYIGQLFPDTPHGTAVYDPVANKEYVVYQAGSDVCNPTGVAKVETDVAQPPFPASCILSLPWNITDVHVSSNNSTGWFAAETGDTGTAGAYPTCTSNCTANDNSSLPANWSSVWGHLYNEVLAVNISTGQIYRLAHHRSRLTNNGTTGLACGGYFTEPRVSMDFSGTRIAFDSSMAKIGSPLPNCVQDYVDTYMIKFR
jgi:hypothetical protein